MPISDCALFDGCYYCHRDDPGDLTKESEVQDGEALQDGSQEK